LTDGEGEPKRNRETLERRGAANAGEKKIIKRSQGRPPYKSPLARNQKRRKTLKKGKKSTVMTKGYPLQGENKPARGSPQD